MREIKFRAWNKSLKMMLSGPLFLIGGDGDFYEDTGWDDVTAAKRDSAGFVVMQFTGLKDKNGKEIYEGDILKEEMCDMKLTVNFGPFDNGDDYEDHVCGNGFYLKGGFDIQHLTPRMASFFEVIGNIYENPELLELK